MRLTFTIAGPPVPKARARVTRFGGTYTPAKTRAYETHVGTCAMAARLATRGWVRTAHYRVALDVYREHRRGDLDNYAKSVIDGCNSILWDDDRQIRDLRVVLHDCADDGSAPRVEVAIEVLP